jgi:hypothetical protein
VIFWVITPKNLIDNTISEEFTAFIFRAETSASSSEIFEKMDYDLLGYDTVEFGDDYQYFGISYFLHLQGRGIGKFLRDAYYNKRITVFVMTPSNLSGAYQRFGVTSGLCLH